MLTRILAAVLAIITLPAIAEPLTLALNWKAEPQFGGFYTAQFGGIYRKLGLDVSLIEGGSGTPTVQILAAGQVDYAIVSADEIVIAHDRGASNVVALFATYQTHPQGIMTHAGRGFASLADVLQSDGLLLWQAGLPYAQYLRKKFAPLRVTTAPYPGGIGNFRSDNSISQQCFVTSEPLSAERAGLQVKTFLVGESGYNPYATVLATTWQHLEANPRQVGRMVAAVRAGWGAYLKDPAPTNAGMAELNKAMDLATFNASAAAQQALIQTPGLPRLGAMSAQRWQTLVEQLREIRVIATQPAPERLFVDL